MKAAFLCRWCGRPVRLKWLSDSVRWRHSGVIKDCGSDLTSADVNLGRKLTGADMTRAVRRKPQKEIAS